jgi:hypothetical protein
MGRFLMVTFHTQKIDMPELEILLETNRFHGYEN